MSISCPVHHSPFLLPLWAVHISDAVLTEPWIAAGWGMAAVLALIGAFRIREEEIARVALLTAAFFVASSIHVPVGPTRVHLLLNGLLGVVLGIRAALAIPIGLAMQAILLGHGGYSTIGVNSCVQVFPALLAWQLFAGLQRVPWVKRPWFRVGLVAVSTLVWVLSLVFCVVLWYTNSFRSGDLDSSTATAITLSPITVGSALVLALLAAWGEQKLSHAPEFPLGLLVGELTVLLTVFLLCAVLILGGDQDWRLWALTALVMHLPIAVIEGIVLGFTVGFLARVKPEMLGWMPPENARCSADPLS